jgi:hypothetical protein
MAAYLVLLPVELLLAVVDYLPVSSIISLKLTSRHLYEWLPTPSKATVARLSQCERIALERYVSEAAHLLLHQRRCIICGGVQAFDFFRDVAPICKWHDGWFMAASHRPLVLEPSIRRRIRKLELENSSCWVTIERSYCVHRREVLGWFMKDCNCECNACGHFLVRCHIRVSQDRDGLRGWQLVESADQTVIIEDRVADGMCLFGSIKTYSRANFDCSPQTNHGHDRQLPCPWNRLISDEKLTYPKKLGDRGGRCVE